MSQIRRFLRNDEAATAVEYAVMLALIILTAIAAIAGVGSATSDMWSESNSQMESHGIK